MTNLADLGMGKIIPTELTVDIKWEVYYELYFILITSFEKEFKYLNREVNTSVKQYLFYKKH